MRWLFLWSFFAPSVLLSALTWSDTTEAAQLRLTWTDRSHNENGFHIERKTGQSGTFTLIAVTAANTTTYTDGTVHTGVTYCYRVRAFNASAVSPYSGEACGSASTTTASTTVWAVNAGGARYIAPDGTVYQADTAFSGGKTYSATTAIAATEEDPLYQSERYGNFSYAIPLAQGNYRIELKFAEIYHAAANKRIFDVYAEGQQIISNLDLFAQVGKNTAYNVTVLMSVMDGTLNLSFSTDIDNAKVSAIKVVQVNTRTLAQTTHATSVPIGQASPAEVNPPSPQNTQPSPLLGGVQIGVFRPTTGVWYVDRNGNGVWDGCVTDGCLGPFGQPGDLPVVGDWTGTGRSSIGVVTPLTGLWQLDRNGNGVWDGCEVDLCFESGEPVHSLPLLGDWAGSGTVSIGTFDAQNGLWQLDGNNDGVIEDCHIDLCLGPFGHSGDLPVVADWTGTGTTKIGVFDPKTGLWALDLNGNGVWDGCQDDGCLGPFGQTGDLPVAAPW